MEDLPPGKLLRSLLYIFIAPQGIHPKLVSFPENPERVTPLDVAHLIPVGYPTQRSVLVNNHGAQMIQLDALAAAHVQSRSSGVLWGLRKRKRSV